MPASVVFAGVALLLAACGGSDVNVTDYPNSTFEHRTEFNAAVDFLWDRLLFWGTVVFVIVEGLLIYTIIKFRHREGGPEPKQVHGNTALEITWTVIPAVILVFIAIPTVKTVFQTQATVRADALQVEVIGHQWWWEFRYPQYPGLTTANELYLPKGRTVNFALQTKDVLHSFWIPRLGGKRDLISNRTNYLWFTPDSTYDEAAVNGMCAEYCGDSHANMKFRVFVVEKGDFERWAQHQASVALLHRPAADSAAPAVSAAPATAAPTVGAAPAATTPNGTPIVLAAQGGTPAAEPTTAAAAPSVEPYYAWNKPLPEYVIPKTPVPAGLDWSAPAGDVERGKQLYAMSSCIGCHAVRGNPMSIGNIGPDLTHVGSRHTIAAGLYKNDTRHLALWIKNARAMKPGSIMPTLGLDQYDPVTKSKVTAGGLTDQQIADIVAYLQALK
jgi:cytochrome c oxidase subunit 2